MVVIPDGREALVTARVEAEPGPLAALLEVATAPTPLTSDERRGGCVAQPREQHGIDERPRGGLRTERGRLLQELVDLCEGAGRLKRKEDLASLLEDGTGLARSV